MLLCLLDKISCWALSYHRMIRTGTKCQRFKLFITCERFINMFFSVTLLPCGVFEHTSMFVESVHFNIVPGYKFCSSKYGLDQRGSLVSSGTSSVGFSSSNKEVSSYVSRSIAGSYANKVVAIFALIFTFYLYNGYLGYIVGRIGACCWFRNCYDLGALSFIFVGAKATTETVDPLSSGAAAMKAMQKATNIDDVEKMMYEVNEQTENMKHIQEALPNPIGANDFDEDEWKLNFEDLEGAELEEQLLQPATQAPAPPSFNV